MRELLLKLVQGVGKNELTKEELKQLKPLIERHILKEGKYFKFNSDYRAGKVEIIKSSGVGFLVQIGVTGKDMVIEPRDLNGAKQDDIVIARRNFRKKGRPGVVVEYIAQRAMAFTVCYLKNDPDDRVNAYDIKSGERIHLRTKQKALRPLPDLTVVKVDNTIQDIIDVLGVLTDPTVDEKIALAYAGRKEEFSSAILKEVRSYGTGVDKSFFPNRKDVTDLPLITIDPKSAKDFDDAIYFDAERFELYVAIADVTSYVHPFSATDEEAKKRGFTIYFPHKSIPMLPRELSENLCSLNENVDRLAFIFKIKLSKENHQIVKYDLFEGVIRSKRRYNYERIDEIFEGEEKDAADESFFRFLEPLSKITETIRKERLSRGFDFENAEIRLDLDKELNLVSTYKEVQTLSHRIIEECMLLTNRCAASYFNEGIFRIHEAPDGKSIKQLIDSLREVGIEPVFHDNIYDMISEVQDKAKALNVKEQVDALIIRSLKRAEYNYLNKGHFGLGFDNYTHFTSPIRRYSDLILHRLLKSIIYNDGKMERFILSQLPFLTEDISAMERKTTKIEWDYEDRVFARWAEKNVGKTFDAVIVDLHPTKDTVVKLDDAIAGARVFVRSGKWEHALFDRVKVTITKSDIASTRISGEFVL
jgi:ribonuclease R